MPLCKEIKKVLVIGSGPIVIGQAAEFDYAGAQACRVLKEAGVNVVLVNSNPATIMTDKALADEIYLEPSGVSSSRNSRTACLQGWAGRPGSRLPCSFPKTDSCRSTACVCSEPMPQRLTARKTGSCSRKPWRRSGSRPSPRTLRIP